MTPADYLSALLSQQSSQAQPWSLLTQSSQQFYGSSLMQLGMHPYAREQNAAPIPPSPLERIKKAAQNDTPFDLRAFVERVDSAARETTIAEYLRSALREVLYETASIVDSFVHPFARKGLAS